MLIELERICNVFFFVSLSFATYLLNKKTVQSTVNLTSGGSDEDRTRYLLHAMEALSQVSYRPICERYYTEF